ncbi:antibiotic biosynthesis monooxygenase family protein [Deinococcus sp.]|uniref:antibiotic biosynthesis monooxygenase family protein n=1 Tax=Deinococcus sp. TaxID=47478 RepID=UPI003CC6209B
MIAVIFEVWPAEGEQNTYLELAANLKADLAHREGFISIERFASLTEPEKLLSLSFWEDEDAVQKWRIFETHRETQSLGRQFVFKDYRLRIAEVARDYGMNQRTQAPADSRAYHDPYILTDKRT